MNLEQAYYISQLISTIALVFSVVYLGRQTRLAARSNFAQMHQARSQQLHDTTLMLTDSELGPLIKAGLHGDTALNDAQVLRFYFFGATQLRLQEEIFRQWKEGTIGTDRWRTTERMVRGMASAPGFRSCFWMLRNDLDVEFVELLDQLIEKSGPATGFELEREWRAGVDRARGLKSKQQG
jgi:hypothetical protein